MSELISVILPVYNGERYLKESIESVLNQSYGNWELLILDDCSSDQTSEIAQEYEKHDHRIHYYRNERNLRLPQNLNKGFSLAQGNFLTWTSDDNRYRPTALEKMYTVLCENRQVQFVYASCRIIDGNGKEIEYIMVDNGGPQRIVGEDAVGACFMYTRQVYEQIGEYDPGFTLVEDFDYWQRVFAKFQTIGIREILYDYRWHNEALTSTMQVDQFNRTLEKMLLKNRAGFGKLNFTQSYYFYRGLYTCRKNLNDPQNPYRLHYRLYSVFFFARYRVPGKVYRMWNNHEHLWVRKRNL